jgi:hypothetical protein
VGDSRVTPGTAVAAATIELVVLDHDVERVGALLDCGVGTFLVDWESLGKDARQLGFDTEIRPGTAADLAAVAALPGVEAWCRLNSSGPHTPGEVEAAIAAGARGLFLPMVKRPADVDRFLSLVRGRAATGILVETVEGLACVEHLASYPLDRVYFGLNDFAISRGSRSIFSALVDGSVARARAAFAGTCFGVGGLTAADAGQPVPCRRLLEEMARLRCDFSFLRRSFRRDLATRSVHSTIAGIRSAWRDCVARDAAAVARDHASLCTIIRDLA